MVFKKTEDSSEWSRFARMMPGQTRTPAEEAAAREQPAEPVPPAREAVHPSAAVAAPARSAAAQPYPRPYGPAAQPEVDEVETTIGVHSTLDGTLHCEAGMRIKGTAQGEITCSKSVIIEESARVNAKVMAANVVVAGHLEGSIVCDGRLEILATGHVTGELSAGVLIIQEGAFFEGHLKMKERRADDHPAAEPAARRFGSPTAEALAS